MRYKLSVRDPLMQDIQRHVWRQRELFLSPTNRKFDTDFYRCVVVVMAMMMMMMMTMMIITFILKH